MEPRLEQESPLSSLDEAPAVVVGREGRIRHLNAAAAALYDLSVGASLPHPVPAIEHDAVALSGQRLHIHRQPVEWMGEAAWRLTVRQIEESTDSITSLKARCRQLEAENRRLTDQLRSDPLTGLLNRRGLDERLRAEQSRLSRSGGALTALLIDLDDFKAVNDAQGYDVGDRALVAVARTILTCVRSSDTVARLGGDEFLVLLPDTGAEVARIVAERIRGSVEALALGTTASLGVMPLSGEALSLPVVLQQSQGTLFSSKSRGKNRTTCLAATPAPDDRARFSTLVDVIEGTPLAHRCLLRPAGGLQSVLLTLDAAARFPGSRPIHLPFSPALLLQQPGLLDMLPRHRRHRIALSTTSLTDEVLPLSRVTPALDDRNIGLCFTDFTGDRRGLEAAVLLRPEVVILHPRQLTSRTPGALERLCATLTSLGCVIFADGIDDAALRARAAAVGILGGSGHAFPA